MNFSCSLWECNEVDFDCFLGNIICQKLTRVTSVVHEANLSSQSCLTKIQRVVRLRQWEGSQRGKLWIIYQQWTEQLATCQRGNNWRPPCTCSCRLPGSAASHCLKFTPLSRSIYHEVSVWLPIRGIICNTMASPCLDSQPGTWKGQLISLNVLHGHIILQLLLQPTFVPEAALPLPCSDQYWNSFNYLGQQ